MLALHSFSATMQILLAGLQEGHPASENHAAAMPTGSPWYPI